MSGKNRLKLNRQNVQFHRGKVLWQIMLVLDLYTVLLIKLTKQRSLHLDSISNSLFNFKLLMGKSTSLLEFLQLSKTELYYTGKWNCCINHTIYEQRICITLLNTGFITPSENVECMSVGMLLVISCNLQFNHGVWSTYFKFLAYLMSDSFNLQWYPGHYSSKYGMWNMDGSPFAIPLLRLLKLMSI